MPFFLRCRRILFFALFLAISPLLAAETTPPSEPKAPAVSSIPQAEPSSQMIMDFENSTEPLRNNLKGESGTWSINEDDNDAYSDIEVLEMPGENGLPTHALQLSYSVDSSLPAQNGFWTKLMDLDASDYDHLEMKVKGDSDKGFTEVFRIEIKKFKDEKKEEKIKGTYEIPVTDHWQTIRIPLNRITGLINFSDPEVWKNPSIGRKHMDEFGIVFNDRHVTVKKGVIYLDDLRLLKTGNPGPAAVDFPERKIDKTPGRTLNPQDYAQFLIGRLGGFPKELVVKKEFPQDDKEFLKVVARDTWQFFSDITDREHGLPLDTIVVGKEKPGDDGVWIGDYTNVTNIGVYLACVVSAFDLGFISREEAVQKLRRTMSTMEKIEYHESGFPYNYYDTTALEKTSYFVSLVDSGWLMAGLYVAKHAFPEELGEQAERLLRRGDFVFFYDPVERQMYHGYYSHLKVYSDYHYGTFYSEPRLASYMAIARGEVPMEHWFQGMVRTFPETYGWQQQIPEGRELKTVLDQTFYGGYYQWKDLRYVPSWGGSAFEALMPALLLDEKDLAPQGLGLNDQRHSEGQMHYALEELGMPVWGMSPSSVPEGGYSEFGAAPFGAKGYAAGVVTPHASILALEYLPKEVVENMRKLISLYEIYGEYGFYDAVRPETGLVARKYLALDQGMILLAINNYLNQGAIHKRFYAEPAIQNAGKLLSAERFFEEEGASAAAASTPKPA